MVVFANMGVVAEVAFAESVLRAGPTGYSVLVAAWTAGMLAGTLAGGRLPGHRLAVTTPAGTIAMGAGIALAGLAAHLWQGAPPPPLRRPAHRHGGGGAPRLPLPPRAAAGPRRVPRPTFAGGTIGCRWVRSTRLATPTAPA